MISHRPSKATDPPKKPQIQDTKGWIHFQLLASSTKFENIYRNQKVWSNKKSRMYPASHQTLKDYEPYKGAEKHGPW